MVLSPAARGDHRAYVRSVWRCTVRHLRHVDSVVPWVLPLMVTAAARFQYKQNRHLLRPPAIAAATTRAAAFEQNTRELFSAGGAFEWWASWRTMYFEYISSISRYDNTKTQVRVGADGSVAPDRGFSRYAAARKSTLDQLYAHRPPYLDTAFEESVRKRVDAGALPLRIDPRFKQVLEAEFAQEKRVARLRKAHRWYNGPRAAGREQWRIRQIPTVVDDYTVTLLRFPWGRRQGPRIGGMIRRWQIRLQRLRDLQALVDRQSEFRRWCRWEGEWEYQVAVHSGGSADARVRDGREYSAAAEAAVDLLAARARTGAEKNLVAWRRSVAGGDLSKHVRGMEQQLRLKFRARRRDFLQLVRTVKRKLSLELVGDRVEVPHLDVWGTGVHPLQELMEKHHVR